MTNQRMYHTLLLDRVNMHSWSGSIHFSVVAWKMWWVTLFLYLSLTHVLPQELDVGDVGISDIKGAGWSRIVSGWDARPGQHPHQALLRLINFHGTVRSCGGTIIHKEWLLTVAHCPAGYTTIVIRAGLIEINKPEMMLESTKVYIYPTFNVSNAMSAQVNDIAMIKLPTPLEYSCNLRAIRIKPISEAFIDYKDVVFYSSGFGRIWTQGDRPDHLQWVYLKGISNEECVGYYNSRSISDNSLCAIGYNETTQSICTGDNGGPLVHVSADGEPTLVAIISFVADSQRGCHSGYPGVFTRTAPFHPWFKEITGIDFENLHEETVPISSKSTDYPPSGLDTSPLPSSISPPSTYLPTTEFISSTPISIMSSINTLDPTTSNTTSSQPTTSSPIQDDKGSESETNDVAQSELLKELEVDVKVKYKLNTKNGNVQLRNADNNDLLKS